MSELIEKRLKELSDLGISMFDLCVYYNASILGYKKNIIQGKGRVFEDLTCDSETQFTTTIDRIIKMKAGDFLSRYYISDFDRDVIENQIFKFERPKIKELLNLITNEEDFSHIIKDNNTIEAIKLKHRFYAEALRIHLKRLDILDRENDLANKEL